MAAPARISLVTLGVRDLAASTRFYESLGWTRAGASTDEISFFATGGAVLALFPAGDLAAESGEPASQEPPGAGQVALACNVATAEDVTRAVAAWSAAGATVLRAPHRADWGGTSAYVADPDGHRWEIAHNPFFPLRPDGSVDLPR